MRTGNVNRYRHQALATATSAALKLLRRRRMGRSPGRPPAFEATTDDVLFATQADDDAAPFFEAAAAAFAVSLREGMGWCRLVVARVGSLEGVWGTAAARVARVCGFSALADARVVGRAVVVGASLGILFGSGRAPFTGDAGGLTRVEAPARRTLL